MATTYYFLDTEWADVTGSELVSLALVNEDGDRNFYAERADVRNGQQDLRGLCGLAAAQRQLVKPVQGGANTTLRCRCGRSRTMGCCGPMSVNVQFARHTQDRLDQQAHGQLR